MGKFDIKFNIIYKFWIKIMFILNWFIYQKNYEKNKNLQDIIVVEMYEIVKIQMHF